MQRGETFRWSSTRRWAMRCAGLLALATTASSQAGIVIGAFDGTRSIRPFSGPDYDNIRSLLFDPANFGPGGVVESGVVLAPEINLATAVNLSGLDFFVIAEVRNLSAAEVSDLTDFVLDGGGLVLVTNSISGGRPGADLMLRALDGGSVTSPTGGNNGGNVGTFVGSGASTDGPFGLLGGADTFAATLGSTLTAGSETVVIGRTLNATFDIMAEIPARALGPVSGGVIVATDVLFMDFFVPPATLYGNESNATAFLNFIASKAPGVGLDIKPGACPNSFNRNSSGVLPVALAASSGFDVNQVDLSTVQLSRADGVGGSVTPHEGPPGPMTVVVDVATPFRGELCDCHELNGDGIPDLFMKFLSNDVVTELLLDDELLGSLIELVLSGNLLDGTPFAANDCIRLVPQGAPPGYVLVESNLPGIWVEVAPMDQQLDGGGFTPFVRTFPDSSVVTFSAPLLPANHPGWILDRWWTAGSVLRNHAQATSITITVNSDVHPIAVSYRPIGE